MTPAISSSSSDDSISEDDTYADSNGEGTSSAKAINSLPKIPKHKFSSRSKAEVDRLRSDLPNLSHHPDDTFRSLSLTELIRLDNKLESGGKSGKKLSEKLAKNLDNIKKFPKKIEAGEDNRADIIHKSRFLGGHICKNSEIWLKTRETLGISGLDPISRYDSEGVGLEGNLNGHIWAALHNPGAKDISIRMLSPEALKIARGESDKDSASCKKDFNSVNEIRLALSTIRTAAQFIHPWNFSFATIEYFLNSVNFGEKDLGSNSEKILFLSNFIDEVFLHNAEAWDDSKTFIGAQKLTNKWVSDVMLKTTKIDSQKTKNTNNFKPNQNNRKNPTSSSHFSKVSFPPGICRRFNFNVCPSQSDDSCPAPWDSAKKLKHVCTFQNQTDKKFCLQNHPFLEHK